VCDLLNYINRIDTRRPNFNDLSIKAQTVIDMRLNIDEIKEKK